MNFEIVVDKEKCIGCGNCQYHCPKGGIIWEIKDKATWCADSTKNTEHCHRCVNCVNFCPQRIINVRVT